MTMRWKQVDEPRDDYDGPPLFRGVRILNAPDSDRFFKLQVQCHPDAAPDDYADGAAWKDVQVGYE